MSDHARVGMSFLRMQESSLIFLGLCMFFVLGASGCSSSKWFKQPVPATVSLSHSASEYMQQATLSEADEKVHYQLLAAHQWMAQNDFDRAHQLLDDLRPEQLSPFLLAEYHVLNAEWELKNHHPDQAARLLQSLKMNIPASSEMQLIYADVATQAFLRNHQFEKSVQAEILLNDLLPEHPLTTSLWKHLQTLSVAQLGSLSAQALTPSTRGWCALALISKKFAHESQALMTGIQNWQKQYPSHVASTLIPEASLLTSAEFLPYQHIALLLPLSGSYGKMGEAVHAGFLLAFYENINHSRQTPTLKVYDTNRSDSILLLYQQAIAEGADLVIGPLLKEEVQTLSREASFTIPTILLNESTVSQMVPAPVIKFGLFPEQSATLVAEQAWQYGVTRLLMITPQNNWGNRIAQAFSHQWQEQGGQIIDSLSFGSMAALPSEISAFLLTEQSRLRIESLENLLKTKVKAAFRKRQDIDGFFLAASPIEARQIESLLKFYYAGDLPIFAVSSVYSGYPNAQDDRDLNGMYFNDIPWVLSTDPSILSLQKKVAALPNAPSKHQERLVALGMDCYLLSQFLPRLQVLPNFPLHGLTGDLTLSQDGTVVNGLSWARFENGVPKWLS